MQTRQHIVIAVLVAAGMMLAGLMIGTHTPHLTMGAAPTSLTSAPPSPSPTTSTPADRAIHAAEAQLSRDSHSIDGYVALATAYMSKARESGDSGYYLRAEAAVQRALEREPSSYEGLRTLAWIQTGKHEFRQALATAERLRAQRPDDPRVYGLLGDAYVELGEYDQAVEAFQQMVDLHPDLASYSRAAYMRELFGDPQGATELMAMAVRAGNGRDPEPLAWCLVHYGNLHFTQGDLRVAEAAYQRALAVFPNYYLALTALGRVRGAQQRYPEATELYRQAVAIVPAPDTVAALGDLLALTGRADEAEKQYTLVEYIEHVNEVNQIAYNRQLALFYADHNRQLDEAVKLAEAELERRHDIYTYDTLAWAYYKKERFADAGKAMEQALRLGTRDASLFFHAGMIAHGLGESEQARDYLHRALDTNPYFALFRVELARSTLAEIEQRIVVQREAHVP